MASAKVSRQNEHFISNVPDDVADKILQLLPIRVAAKTSVLSKQWRRNWLSLQCLNFNGEFFEKLKNEDGICNWQKCSNIISNIFLHHNGPVHDFKLYIPRELDEEFLDLSQWLCFLSKNAVKRITLINCRGRFGLSSYIFHCSELVHLELNCFGLRRLPTGTGFPKLQNLVLVNLTFSDPNSLHYLIAKSPVLATFKHVNCLGIMEPPDLLASLCQLECIQFGDNMCKYLAAANIPRPFPMTFNNLSKLCLIDLYLDRSCVVDYICGMIESCPFMKELDISVVPCKASDEHKIICNANRRLDHLCNITFSGIVGTKAELKLIEYLLAISVVLDKLLVKCHKFVDTNSELSTNEVSKSIYQGASYLQQGAYLIYD